MVNVKPPARDPKHVNRPPTVRTGRSPKRKPASIPKAKKRG